MGNKMKIISYKFAISGPKRPVLEDIRMYLDNGYQPYGSPFTATNVRCLDADNEIWQAMVKYEEESDD